MLLSLITVCHGRWEYLRRVWPSWRAQTWSPIEFVVVAAGPDDSPLQLLREGFPGKLVRVTNAPYFQLSAWRNVGARYACGEWLAFVDCDILLHPDWARKWMEQCGSGELFRLAHFQKGVVGTCGVARWVYEKVRGYNENMDEQWGLEDYDFYRRVEAAGGRVQGYRGDYLTHLHHSDAARAENMRIKVLDQRNLRKIEREDRAVHAWETNRRRRCDFPAPRIEVLSSETGAASWGV